MKELVLLCGPPGSGKSTYTLPGYIRVASDEAPRVYARTHEALKTHDRVVVDRTFASRADRARFVELGRSLGFTVRAVVFTTDRETCVTRCRARFATHPIIKTEVILTYAFSVYDSAYQPVELTEFDAVEYTAL